MLRLRMRAWHGGECTPPTKPHCVYVCSLCYLSYLSITSIVSLAVSMLFRAVIDGGGCASGALLKIFSFQFLACFFILSSGGCSLRYSKGLNTSVHLEDVGDGLAFHLNCFRLKSLFCLIIISYVCSCIYICITYCLLHRLWLSLTTRASLRQS